RPKPSSDVFVSYAQCSVFKEPFGVSFFSAARSDLNNIAQAFRTLQPFFKTKFNVFSNASNAALESCASSPECQQKTGYPPEGEQPVSHPNIDVQ
ncbi:hypothetical protein, partial [Cohnella boryungensis]